MYAQTERYKLQISRHFSGLIRHITSLDAQTSHRSWHVTYCEKKNRPTLWLRKPFERVKQFDPSSRAAVETNPATAGTLKREKKKGQGSSRKEQRLPQMKRKHLPRKYLSCDVKKSANTVSDLSELSALLRYNFFKLTSLNSSHIQNFVKRKMKWKKIWKVAIQRIRMCISLFSNTLSETRFCFSHLRKSLKWNSREEVLAF